MTIPVFAEVLLLIAKGSLYLPAVIAEKEMPVVVVDFPDAEKEIAIADEECFIAVLEFPVSGFVMRIAEQGEIISALIIPLS